MFGFNLCVFAGNLGRDPDIRYTPNDVAVCEFTVAANTKRGDDEHTYWVNCKAFGRLAEICKEYLHKGKPVIVQGRMQRDSWEDKDSGKKVYKDVFLVDQMQMIPTGERKGTAGDSPSNFKPPAKDVQF